MQQQFATPGGDAGGPPPSKETTQSRQEEEANAKVLHVEQAAERLLREQQEHHQQEIAAYLKQAQAGHDILKRQESRAITQRDEAIEAIRVRSVGQEAAAKQAVQHLESQQAKLMQQEMHRFMPRPSSEPSSKPQRLMQSKRLKLSPSLKTNSTVFLSCVFNKRKRG